MIYDSMCKDVVWRWMIDVHNTQEDDVLVEPSGNNFSCLQRHHHLPRRRHRQFLHHLPSPLTLATSSMPAAPAMPRLQRLRPDHSFNAGNSFDASDSFNASHSYGTFRHLQHQQLLRHLAFNAGRPLSPLSPLMPSSPWCQLPLQHLQHCHHLHHRHLLWCQLPLQCFDTSHSLDACNPYDVSSAAFHGPLLTCNVSLLAAPSSATLQRLLRPPTVYSSRTLPLVASLWSALHVQRIQWFPEVRSGHTFNAFDACYAF